MSDKGGPAFFGSNLIESHQGWHSVRKANAITKIGARPLALSAVVNTRSRLLDKERKWIPLRRSECAEVCLSRR
jgi:hypothetical protein